MLVVANRIYVSSGHEADFEARFQRRPHLVEESAGFLRNDVLRPLTPGAPYVVMTQWRDRAAFEGWVKSPAFREAHKNPPPEDMFARESELELHETLDPD